MKSSKTYFIVLVVIGLATLISSLTNNICLSNKVKELNVKIDSLENLVKESDKTINNKIDEVSKNAVTKEEISTIKNDLLDKMNIITNKLNTKVDKNTFEDFSKKSLENDAELKNLKEQLEQIKTITSALDITTFENNFDSIQQQLDDIMLLLEPEEVK